MQTETIKILYMKKYYLCSKEVIEHFPDVEKSKPFKSGYGFEKDDYYVAKLDFKKVDKYYKSVIKPYNDNANVNFIDFWMYECHAGSMDVFKITIAGAKRNGLFVEIENKIGLTAERNIAMSIFNLSNKYNCTPIELINKIVGKKNKS